MQPNPQTVLGRQNPDYMCMTDVLLLSYLTMSKSLFTILTINCLCTHWKRKYCTNIAYVIISVYLVL